MPRLYGDLEKLYDGTCKDLQLRDETRIRHLDKGRLVSWIREELFEMKVYLQAIFENNPYEDSNT